MTIIAKKTATILDSEFEKELLTKIGDGKKSIFIEESLTLKKLLNTFFKDIAKDFTEDIIDETIKVQRKIGLVYLPNEIYNSPNRTNAIIQITPPLEYIKDNTKISTIDYIKHYSDYNLFIKNKNFTLSVVMYSETI